MLDDTKPMKTVSLMKGQHQFILRYESGSEKEAIDVLIGWVKDDELRFDWFDAALMSKQIGMSLSGEQ